MVQMFEPRLVYGQKKNLLGGGLNFILGTMFTIWMTEVHAKNIATHHYQPVSALWLSSLSAEPLPSLHVAPGVP